MLSSCKGYSVQPSMETLNRANCMALIRTVLPQKRQFLSKCNVYIRNLMENFWESGETNNFNNIDKFFSDK